MIIYGAGFNHLFSIVHPMYVQYIRLIVYMPVWNSKVQNAFKMSHLAVQTAAARPLCVFKNVTVLNPPACFTARLWL